MYLTGEMNALRTDAYHDLILLRQNWDKTCQKKLCKLLEQLCKLLKRGSSFPEVAIYRFLSVYLKFKAAKVVDLL